jgi:hypothetical protein
MLEKYNLLLGTQAWKELKGASVKVYIFLRSKTYGSLRDPETVRGEIKVPYSIMEKETGLSRQSVRNAILQLENLGFIELKEQGGLKSGGYGTNIYTLSLRFSRYGTSMFEKGQLKKEQNVRGRGFGKVWEKRKRRPILERRIKQEANIENISGLAKEVYQ